MKKNRRKQNARSNGDGQSWPPVQDARFVGPEAHPPGTDRTTLQGNLLNLRRPQGAEPGIHADDPRPRCYRRDQIGHLVGQCHAKVILADDPNPPRNA